jgi:hypothetical protein
MDLFRRARWAFALVMVGALIGATNACGGDEESGARPDETTTTETRTQQTGPNEETREIRKYLEENYGPGSPIGERSWYDTIISVDCCSAFDGKATIETTSLSSAEVESICLAVILSGQAAGAKVMNPKIGTTLAQCP